jgi:hypothetical protein
LNTNKSKVSHQSKQGFGKPPQPTELASYLANFGNGEPSDSDLRGKIDVKDSVEDSAGKPTCASYHVRPALNRNTRRRLAREIEAKNYHIRHSPGVRAEKALIEVRKHMARPPGCAFLGSNPVEATATVNGLDVDPLITVIDSGSDITLISQKALDGLSRPPKVKAGQNIKLIQVTGKSSISGFVTLDLFYHLRRDPYS